MSCLKILDLLVFVTLFKVIAKSLTDRLKPHLPTFIDQSQAAFIENRHISSNIGNSPPLYPQELEPAGFPP
jgi:hypothetical protein